MSFFMPREKDGSLLLLEEASKLYTHREIAEYCDVTPRTVQRWLTGETPPRQLYLPLFKSLLNPPKAADQENQQFTFIDLFAGIGGMRLGFESAGGQCIYTCEWDSYAQKTYRANFDVDHEIVGDICAIKDKSSIPDHDVLLAGFPCQPFSIAGVSKKISLGRKHGFEDEAQGTLFFEILQILKIKKPKAFLLENVKNLYSHDRGNTFRVIINSLKALGYVVGNQDHSHRIIDGRYWVPQHRERTFIAGFLQDTGFSWNNLRIPSFEESPVMADILHSEDGCEDPEFPYTEGSRAKISDKYVLSDHLWDYLQNYAAKHRAKGNGFGFGLVGPDDVSRTLSARYYKDGSEILVKRGKNKSPRRLTPRECARLMGFDSPARRFQIPVSDTRAYKQFGNAVIPPVVAAIAQLMKPHILALKNMDGAAAQQTLLSLSA